MKKVEICPNVMYSCKSQINDTGATYSAEPEEQENPEENIWICMPRDILPDWMNSTKSYGIRTVIDGEDIVANVILKHTIIPAKETRVFYTSVENQTGFDIDVYENDYVVPNVSVEDSVALFERCTVKLTSGLPKGSPIEVTFNLDVSKDIVATVYDATNGVSEQVKLTRIEWDNSNSSVDSTDIGSVLR